MKIFKICKYEVDPKKRFTEQDIKEKLAFWPDEHFKEEFPNIKERPSEYQMHIKKMPPDYYKGIKKQEISSEEMDRLMAEVQRISREKIFIREYYLVESAPEGSLYFIFGRI